MTTAAKEHAGIFSLYESIRSGAGSGVLATIVRTSGSTYRRPGARMLVTDDGRSAGLISGGCLEQDLRERSAEVFRAGKPLLVTYDSSSPGDILWGLGLGCTGIAHILLERVSGAGECRALEFIEECRRARSPGAIASPYMFEGLEGEVPGPRVFLRDGTPRRGIGAGYTLAAALERACMEALSAQHSSQLTVTLSGGKAEAFIEYVSPPVSLFVFGAGPDAVPLVRLAKELGWHVTIVDWREAYLKAEAFPSADSRVLAHPGEADTAFTVPRGAAAVVMSHNFNNDAAILRTLLASGASYVGLLGPRAKSDLMMNRLAEEGFVPSEEEMAHFHSPVGLDIGAETPEEIALAIVAEIQATVHERPGTPLRRREGPIHR